MIEDLRKRVRTSRSAYTAAAKLDERLKDSRQKAGVVLDAEAVELLLTLVDAARAFAMLREEDLRTAAERRLVQAYRAVDRYEPSDTKTPSAEQGHRSAADRSGRRTRGTTA